MNASDVMRTSFVRIKPNASRLEAAQLLLETNQRALPVMARRWTCGVYHSYPWFAGVLSWG